MRILAVHSYYQWPGGEDLSYEAECQLLERRGHEVIRFTLSNQVINAMPTVDKAARMLWNRDVLRELRNIIRDRQPEVMHCTNLFPLMSPSCYWAAARERVPIVQALRNYRLLCPAVTLFRDGQICQDCLGHRFPWPAIRHHCYRESHLASASVATISFLSQAVGSADRVHLYYTPSHFARERFLDGGLDPQRVFVKPNFLEPDPGPGDGRHGGAIFVGRLSPEKGIDSLLEAWRHILGPIPLRIVGDGPLAPRVIAAAATDSRIHWLGYQPNREALDLIGRAGCLVMPSVWYETFGRVMLEAFARRTPVVVSDLGAMAEIVEHERTGLRYPPGNAVALANTVQTVLADRVLAGRLADRAREVYLRSFTGDANYVLLMDLYRRAIAFASGDQSQSGQTTQDDTETHRVPRPQAGASSRSLHADEPKPSA